LQEESPSKLILATELHNIPNIQYSYHGTFLASCSISGRIVVYSGSPFKEIANLTHKNWMWSVTWISKSEVEELSPSLVYSKKSSKYGDNLEELEDYLLLCSDATKFYLIEFTRAVTQDGFKMNIISERKVRLPFLFGVPANSLRFSISTKLKGHPVVVSALQHSPLIVIIHISMYNGVYILSNREIGHGLDKVIVGMDAFLSTSPEGNVINILTLNFDTPSIDYIKLKLSKALLLAR
jgi:hypothetical protein